MSATNQTDEAEPLGLEVVDQVDGRFVLRVTSSVEDADELLFDDSVDVELTAGAGEIERDPYTGRLLLSPSGADPVRGRAVQQRAGAAALLSPEAALGMRVDDIAADQLKIGVAGGGACAARWQLAMDVDFKVNVRASVMANVVPLTTDRRELTWRHGAYFAHDPIIGFMRLTYNSDFVSKIVLEAQDPASFFPSRIDNNIHFVIDFVDLGYRGFNRTPMRQRVDDVRWPPFEDPVLAIEEPLEFYNVDAPDQLLMTLMSQDMRLYDYSSLDVERLDASIDADGRLSTRWRITNQADERARVRWFALGDVAAVDQAPTEGTRLLGAAGSGFESMEVELPLRAGASLLTQSVSMNAVSLTDSILAGRAGLDFRHNDDEHLVM